MVDTATREQLKVSTGGRDRCYLNVSVDQLDEVRQLLDKHGLRYEVDEYVISMDGEPEIALVHLARGTDAATIQALLDGAH